MNFGDNIRRLRLQKKFTQEYVAERLMVSAQSVSRWETSATFPDILLLPEMAKLYGVTVDDLFRENSVSYENYAHRLLAVYEASGSRDDYLAAETEFLRLKESGTCSMKDLCMFGMLYQYGMTDCTRRAEKLFSEGLELGESNDPNTYHWIERQMILLNAQTGRNRENIIKYKQYNAGNPNDLYGYVNLIQSYLHEGENQNALEVFLSAKSKFDSPRHLYRYGGRAYMALGRYDKAIECFERDYEIDSSFTHSLWGVAECYEKLDDLKNAYKTYRKIESWYKSNGFNVEEERARLSAERCLRK